MLAWEYVFVGVTLSLLLYPGLALALGLGLLYGRLLALELPGSWPGMPALRTPHGLAALASIGLSALGLALLPWPYHPAAGWRAIGSPLALWAAFELAFLAPLLPGLLAPQPLAARSAAREMQMSMGGRCVLWLAIGASLWGGAGWAPLVLPGRLLIGLAMLLVLPVALGAGPFAAERSLSVAGAEAGLDEPTAGLVRFARLVRGAALLAAASVALLPLGRGTRTPPQLQPWAGLALAAALFVVAALLLRQLAAVMPRLTLPAALRWCWSRALPLALVGMAYLALVRG